MMLVNIRLIYHNYVLYPINTACITYELKKGRIALFLNHISISQRGHIRTYSKLFSHNPNCIRHRPVLNFVFLFSLGAERELQLWAVLSARQRQGREVSGRGAASRRLPLQWTSRVS